MPNSMTGFGRAEVTAPCGEWVIEMHSVNRKYLDISIAIPKEFGRWEQGVRQWICKKIFRGQVTVRIYFTASMQGKRKALPDIAVLQDLKRGWKEIAQALGMDSGKIDLPFLAQQVPVQENMYFATEEEGLVLRRGVEEALERLVSMRQREGAALAADIERRIAWMRGELAAVKNRTSHAPQRLQKRLEERLKGLDVSCLLADDRMLREIVMYTEKLDVTEEITRLFSHLDQCDKILQTPAAEGVGRNLDFLMQEIGRELNTLGAKSAEIEVSHSVVWMKSELEKIKEQVQNLE